MTNYKRIFYETVSNRYSEQNALKGIYRKRLLNRVNAQSHHALQQPFRHRLQRPDITNVNW